MTAKLASTDINCFLISHLKMCVVEFFFHTFMTARTHSRTSLYSTVHLQKGMDFLKVYLCVHA